jgi:acyl-CoA synthetase (AMP-forming)/AMP-acid ligase II
MVNLWDSLYVEGPRAARALTVYDADERQRMLWPEVISQAETYADGLRRRGVRGGDVVGAVLTNSGDAVAGLLGIWLAGAVVASLPVPARGMELPQYANQVLELARSFDAPFLLSDGPIADALNAAGAEGSRSVLGWSEVRGSGRLSDAPPTGEEIAFIQYSSGSTSAPKGCMLSARAIEAQLDLILTMLDAAPTGEVAVSWLPLSHDMGLFGCLLPACAAGADLFLSSPERFLRAPRSWFRDCIDTGATVTAGPNSALRLAARATRSVEGSRRLRLNHIVVGAERIQPQTLEAVLERFGGVGLTPSTFMCAYGMAEATLAVTVIDKDEAPSDLTVDGFALADGIVKDASLGADGATRITSVGRPPAGVSVSLGPEAADSLAEIRVRSDSLASGYFKDPEQTRARFSEGELLTGDLGFMRDDQLYVVGRLDDMISVGGRNVYAAEVESALASLGAIRRGCCTIVDVAQQGHTKLVALAELSDDSTDLPRLAAEMSKLASRAAGVRLDECLFLAKGSLPKTPSGKTQRYRSRALATQSGSGLLARIALT